MTVQEPTAPIGRSAPHRPATESDSPSAAKVILLEAAASTTVVMATEVNRLTEVVAGHALDQSNAAMMGDAPACEVCGSITVRNGSCYKCLNCGNSMGCS